MDNKSDGNFLIIQATIDSNRQDTDEKQMKTNEKLPKITEIIKILTAFMMYQTNNSKFSPAQRDTSTPPDPTTVVLNNRTAPPLDGVKSTKIGGIWNLKH